MTRVMCRDGIPAPHERRKGRRGPYAPGAARAVTPVRRAEAS
jgi:hypothetical protein